MKKLLMLILLVLLISCRDKSQYLYLNEKFILVKASESSGLSNDKFRNPMFVKIWLIQRVSNPIEHAEVSSYEYSGNDFRITNKLWYNRSIGDTLYFEYIRKNRFFNIDKR